MQERVTRSGLYYEGYKILKEKRPSYSIIENVKNLTSKRFKPQFDSILRDLLDLGYNNYYQVLNAKDFGIPQNRERVYIVSIRKDIDKGNFKFPEKEELELRLKDMLEDEVDEKYYLNNEQIEKIRHSNFIQEKKRIQEKEYSDTIFARDWKDPKCVRVGGIFDTEKSKHQEGSVYDKKGLAPTLDSMQGGWRQPCIEIKNATKKGYIEAVEGDSVNLSYPTSNTRRGRVGKGLSQTLQCNDAMGVVIKKDINVIGNYMPSNHNASRIVDNEGIAPTVKENYGTVTATNIDMRIRKLTPKECWRLMRFF